jgi:hypothetical protein
MKVQITQQEDFAPHIWVQANETIYKVETIDEWIRQLRIARAWLVRKKAK